MKNEWVNRIVLAGAGSLGSRHLQALARLESPSDIHVIDPAPESIRVARERWRGTESFERHRCTFYGDISELPEFPIDLGIVATSSAVRAGVIRRLLKNRTCTYLILEKILFQTLGEYEEIGQLLNEAGTSAYVNCPRRIYEEYRAINAALGESQPLHMEVVGNCWGLGCNGIHFVDLFHYLTGEPVSSWKNELDDGMIESKRSGYKEFSGRLSGRSKSGNTLTLCSFRKGPVNISVRITTPAHRWVIAEGLGRMWEEQVEPEWEIAQKNFRMPYQSELTDKVVVSLMEEGTCMLPTYSVAKTLHLPFIDTLLAHVNQFRTEPTKRCPIT